MDVGVPGQVIHLLGQHVQLGIVGIAVVREGIGIALVRLDGQGRQLLFAVRRGADYLDPVVVQIPIKIAQIQGQDRTSCGSIGLGYTMALRQLRLLSSLASPAR